MSSLKEKSVLVVGGSSGIGFATAQAALIQEARVTIASRGEEGLRAAAERLGSAHVETALVDLLNNDSIESLFHRRGSFDHIVITAARTKSGPVRSLALADAQASMDSKFWGAYRIAKAARLNEGGSLTFVSGFLSKRPSATSVLQGAINAALEGLARGLALELAPIRVNTVSPGLIDTALYGSMPAEAKANMLANATERLPVHRVGAAEDVAQAILLLATNPYMTGSTVVVDGGGTIAA